MAEIWGQRFGQLLSQTREEQEDYEMLKRKAAALDWLGKNRWDLWLSSENPDEWHVEDQDAWTKGIGDSPLSAIEAAMATEKDSA